MNIKRGISFIFSSLLLVCLAGGLAWAQAGQPESKIDAFRLSHIRSFEPFADVKGNKSEGLAIDILTAAFAKVKLKVVFVGEDQDKEQDSLVNSPRRDEQTLTYL